MTPALLRYLAADALRAERWVAPLTVYLVACAAGTAVGGTALGSYGLSASLLFPVALWVGVGVSNAEDRVQTAVTVVTVGSALAVRLGKVAVAFAVCLGLVPVALLWPVVTGHAVTAADLAAGAAAHVTVAAAGTAAGAALSRPLVTRPAWVVIGGVGACLLEILVPGVPPVRPIALLLTDDASVTADLARRLAVVAAETAALATVVVGAGHAAARTRD